MVDEPTVTLNQAYLKTIEKKVEDLKTLIEVSAIISSTLDFSDLMILTMEKAKAVMGAEACSILLYDKKDNKLKFDLALSREEGISDILRKRVTLDMGQGVAGWVAEHRASLLMKDAKTDSRFCPEADHLTGFTTRSLMAVPLVGRGGLIGVAEILNPKDRDFFSDYDLELFQTLSRQIAIAIENARFHEESLERTRPSGRPGLPFPHRERVQPLCLLSQQGGGPLAVHCSHRETVRVEGQRMGGRTKGS